jgi:hypothetical protein
MIRSVDVIYPTVIIDDVRVKLSESLSNFLFSGFHIIGWAPVVLFSIKLFLKTIG